MPCQPYLSLKFQEGAQKVASDGQEEEQRRAKENQRIVCDRDGVGVRRGAANQAQRAQRAQRADRRCRASGGAGSANDREGLVKLELCAERLR